MQVKEKKEPERLKKGPFPWQMILFTAVLTVARHLFPAFGKTGRIRNGAEGSG